MLFGCMVRMIYTYLPFGQKYPNFGTITAAF